MKAKESEATEDSFEVDDAEFPVSSLDDASGQASIELFTGKENEGNVDNEVLDEIKDDQAPEKTDNKRFLFLVDLLSKLPLISLLRKVMNKSKLVSRVS